ncbi:nucleotide pyrophosphohydrolase [Bacillus phage Baseball_field]|uniref:Nucleotide pyrophosphohydrolase n=1 Tax=Bacillus phage Baseball_field TaxID=2756144 RepID=A0A7L7SNW6_9CAUD|nr:nucleoside triphosphate pyrophosphohydrolase [Bacillus phage Baseball_field]QOC56868.1 nucleotide pyrophosphohydrolase [Bacillus phage Baseball_field]
MMKDMLKVQKKVDLDISNKIEIPFKETITQRKIAFKVELSELVNEVGFFKYWKTSHKIINERVLDEWADCFAFLNSIVISQGYEDYVISYYIKRLEHDIESSTFIRQDWLFRMMNKNEMDSIDDVLSQYFYLYMFGKNLGYSVDEMNSAYNTKSMVNMIRAKEGY